MFTQKPMPSTALKRFSKPTRPPAGSDRTAPIVQQASPSTPVPMPAPALGRPMTPAERQRRHRIKRKAEEAARMQAQSAGAMSLLLSQNATLLSRAEAAERTLAELRPARQQRDALQARLDAVAHVVRSLLPRLSPAGRMAAHAHFREAGFIEWLDSG